MTETPETKKEEQKDETVENAPKQVRINNRIPVQDYSVPNSERDHSAFDGQGGNS